AGDELGASGRPIAGRKELLALLEERFGCDRIARRLPQRGRAPPQGRAQESQGDPWMRQWTVKDCGSHATRVYAHGQSARYRVSLGSSSLADGLGGESGGGRWTLGTTGGLGAAEEWLDGLSRCADASSFDALAGGDGAARDEGAGELSRAGAGA